MDNIDVTPGTGATIAADNIDDALHQRVKLTIGADGINDGDVSSSNPMPIGLYDAMGNAISSSTDPLDDSKHVQVSIIQDIGISTDNSTTGNLTSGGTFTGTGVSLSSANAISVTFFADQNCNIEVQQSSNGTNWDIIERFTGQANTGQFRIVPAVGQVFRVIATNLSASSTTSLRLQTKLLPICPPNPNPLSGNRTVTGTITTACSDVNINVCPASSAVVINAEGAGTVIAQHNGSWTGLVVFDVSYDNGLTWEMQPSIDISVNSLSDNLRYFVKWSQTRINDRWAINCAGAQLVRLRASTLSAGSIPVILTASQATFYTNRVERRNPTYSAGAVGFTTANTATDIACLTGSATKTIKVFSVGYSATQNTQDFENVTLIKRTSANTGGTSASMTAVSYDSQDGAASGTAVNYTANPSALGTSAGTFKPSQVLVPAGAPGNAASAQCEKVWDFSPRSEDGRKPLYLRGTSESLCINQNAATFAGNNTTVYFEWTEE